MHCIIYLSTGALRRRSCRPVLWLISLLLAHSFAVAAIGKSGSPPSPLSKQGMELRKLLDRKLPATHDLNPIQARDLLTPLFSAYLPEGMDLISAETVLTAAGFAVWNWPAPNNGAPVLMGNYKGSLPRGLVSQSKLIVRVESKIIDGRPLVSAVVARMHVAMP